MFNSRSKTNYKTQKQVFLVLLAHMAKESELVRNVTNYAGKNSRMIQGHLFQSNTEIGEFSIKFHSQHAA